MIHPKMQYTYVGIDSHKDTHTAVFLDCFFEKLGVLSFDNLPSAFGGFLEKAQQYRIDGTTLLFGLEDTSSYGRTLTIFLKANGMHVKHVNGLLVSRERKNRNITEKTDFVDAECAARILLSKFGELPDAQPNDRLWILRSLVVRRSFLVRQTAAAKHYLHSLLTQHYPNYRSFFSHVDGKASLAFFMKYPSPGTLRDTSLEELTALLKEASGFSSFASTKAKEILDTLQYIASFQDTDSEFQGVRDEIVQSTIKQILYNKDEIERLETSMAAFLSGFNCTLTSMVGIDTVTAAKLLSCIGDIKSFPTPAKLARYAGIAPVTYASGKKDLQFANQRGNRELNNVFYRIAMVLIATPSARKKVLNPIFYDYYHRKISEGKTKNQALKCVQRRLVNIVWSMLTYGEDYVNPPMFDLVEDGSNDPGEA